MIIPLPNAEDFSIRPVLDGCFLINPRTDFKLWTENTLKYRSCIIDSDGKPVSLSFFKFFNLGERENLGALPKDLNGVTFVEKCDGSLICISKPHRDSPLIVRTRGSHEVFQHDTGEEVWGLIKKYKIEEYLNQFKHNNYTLLFEHVTPNHQIVVRYPEPDLIFIGAVLHEDYSLVSQKVLDGAAVNEGWKRPKVYTFTSYDEAIETISNWPGGCEGVVAYYENDQKMIKIKSKDYLLKHRLKADLGSIEKLIEVYFAAFDTGYFGKLYDYLLITYDFEIAEFCKENCKYIEDLMYRTNQGKLIIEDFVNDRAALNQKDFAKETLDNWEKSLTSFVFSLRSKGKIDFKKLLMNLHEKAAQNQKEAVQS